MAFTPPQARQYKVTVPTHRAAKKVARRLADRGHRVVTARISSYHNKYPTDIGYDQPTLSPEAEAHWDVLSLVTGPDPDDDSSWWSAMEEKALRELARRHDGFASCQSTHPNNDERFRSFNREGLQYELDEKTASQRRLKALQDCPPRASKKAVPSPDQDVPSGPGEPIPLEGVDAVDWSALDHAYGDATDVPEMLRTLSMNDERWEKADSKITSSVLHQETIYSSTAPTMTFLAQIAAAPQLSAGRRQSLLYTLFIAGSQQAVADADGYELGDIGPAVRDAVVAQVGRLLELWPVASHAEQQVLLLLAALASQSPAGELGHLDDPPSRLARAMLRGLDGAEALLREMAKSNEELIELTEGDGRLHARLVAALLLLIS